MEAKMTKKGRELLCKAHAGDVPLSPVTVIALGDGGCTEGIPNEVTGLETGLVSELIRKEITSHQYLEEMGEGYLVEKVKMQYSIALGENELVNEKISEAGLIDSNGILVAYLTFLEKGKDDGMEFVFHVDEIF